jgi:PAS domain S-box-containing protein
LRTEPGSAIAFLNGGGEVGALMRARDWSASPLGPPEIWPQALRTTIRLMFNSGTPMFVWWGEELVCLYNDAYRQAMSGDISSSLGRPAREVWRDHLHRIMPQIDHVRSGLGPILGPTPVDNQAVPVSRGGVQDDTYWTNSYSAIEDERAPNGIGGVLALCTETTRQMQAQQRLTAEHERQRKMFQRAPGFIAVFNGPMHRFEFANDAYLRLLGQNDVIGKSLRAMLPNPTDPDAAEQLFPRKDFVAKVDRVYRSGRRLVTQQTIELPHADADNPERCFLEFICEPIFHDHGTVSGVFVEGFDVTDRREIQASLHDLNTTLEMRIEQRTRERNRVWKHSPDLLVMLDRDGVFREISPAWTRVLGHAPEEVVGHSFFEFIHPDDAYTTYKDAGRSDLANYVNRYVHKDGTLRWISWNTSSENDVICAYGRDITKEKLAQDALELSEARLRTIFESSHLFQGLLNLDGTVVDTNATSLAAINATLADVVGKPFWDAPWFATTPGMRELVMKGVADAAAGQTVHNEVQVNLPVGGARWFDFMLCPVRNSQGQVVGIVPEGMELTERKLAEEALRQSQKLEAMGQLTGGVAHDFNNLLTPIIGGMDILQRSKFGGEREHRILDAALQSAEKARMVVQRLLAFARRQPLQPVAVDVASLVTGMADLVSSTTGPQIDVIVNVADHIPPAKADPHQIEMAILNLGVNARDAMSKGGTLRISAISAMVGEAHRSRLPPGRYVSISVTDTGTGMDAATLRRAVEPFFSTKGIGKGTGLGLSMVHGVASQLGGALVISSEPGLGTNVELWLPLSETPLPVIEPANEAMREQLCNGHGTALVVDDEDLVRASTADMLTELGYAVVEANSGEDALRVIDAGVHVNVLITDHLMPGMSGVDLVRAVRQRHPDMPALIVSGYAEVEDLAPDLPRLTKPFRQTDLAASIESLAMAA